MVEDTKKNPEWYLNEYTTNLNQKIQKNIDDTVVVGREKEMLEILYSLARKTKNNPVLIGEAGVGKTAIIEGITKKIVLNQVPIRFRNVTVYSLALADLGKKGEDGDLIYRLKMITKALENRRDRIIFIDEIHTIAGTGATKGALDAGNILKPALSRGEIQLVGATTLDEYHKYLENDKALERRFQTIRIEEPTEKEAIEIMKGLKIGFENFHQVKITNEAVVSSVELSERYLPEHRLPDKSIDLLDEAASIASLNKQNIVDREDIAKVLQDKTGIPTTAIMGSRLKKIYNLENELEKDVKGQKEALEEIASVLKIKAAGLEDQTRPIASFIFLGPTGVGKTASAKALAKALFDDEKALIRFDMSEYQEKEDIKRLIGTKKEKGQLTEAIRRHPYSVVLFDEIEKADKSVYDILLQILDDGRITDALGNTANCKNTIIILTTNLGSELIQDRDDYIGKMSTEKSEEIFRKQVEDELKGHFRPEFVNRLDHKIVFNTLDIKTVEQVTRKFVNEINKKMGTKGYSLDCTPEAINYLSRKGYDPKNGARPVARAVNKLLTSPIAEYILDFELNGTSGIRKIKVTVIGEKSNKYDRLGTEKLKFIGYKS
ncbi:AAA family ATPase [Liquorilactobacillus hordei]|uniref:AAA family ATPase n=1 Tax=Liquorilactobacillus hordei TaxID=468911 RepID=UPI001CBDFE30|nr:ATP-dependent Clp protease ATP-binding subunit [Liquorilactobacillus hordei]MBZ2406657.1 AAA family ATPase [Liquorilactobacillus hordei]